MDISNLQRMEKAHALEELYEWDKWREEIPLIKFDPDWEVKIIPPTGGAVVRFLVRKGSKEISVYLDCYGLLGFFGSPYWEAYPIGEDVARVGIHDVKSLMQIIRLEFEKSDGG